MMVSFFRTMPYWIPPMVTRKQELFALALQILVDIATIGGYYAAMAQPQSYGKWAERMVNMALRINGRSVQTSNTSDCDLLVDGRVRVEVKGCGGIKKRTRSGIRTYWQFNIHRHGKMPGVPPDCYILRLDGVPESVAAIHLLFTKLSTPNVLISMRNLLNQKFHKEVKDYYHFAKSGKLPQEAK